MTKRAASKLRLAVQWLYLYSTDKEVYSKKTKSYWKFRVNFITLTLSDKQIHDDDYIKNRMLQPFLKWLYRNGARLYVWRAETQKNGNIHFHINTDQFIHWKRLRKKWNKIQWAHGYKKHFDPNSTDVHMVRDPEALGSYMAKYMTKSQPGRRAIEGRLWGCSTELSRMKVRIADNQLGFDKSVFTVAQNSDALRKDFCTIYLYTDPVPIQEDDLIHETLMQPFRELQKKIQTQTKFEIE